MFTEGQRGHPKEGPSEKIIEYEFNSMKVGPVLWGINSYGDIALEANHYLKGLEHVLSDIDAAELLFELADEKLDAYRGNSNLGAKTEDWYRAAGFHGLYTMADSLSRVMGVNGAISKESVVMGLAAVKTRSGNTVIEELMSLDVIKDDEGKFMYGLGLDAVNEGYTDNPAIIFKSLMNQAIEALPEE